MESSNLYRLIRSLSAVERRDAARFLESPYFNTRADLIRLFGHLVQSHEPSKTDTWAALYPGEAYDDTKFRLLLSYLNRLLETFLLVEESTRNKGLSERLSLAKSYRQRGLLGHHERQMRAVERELDTRDVRNAGYHQLLLDLQRERHETQLTQNPTDTESLRALGYQADVAYLTHRLRLICLELAQKNVYFSADEQSAHHRIIELADRREWCELPGIATYLAACRMLAYPEDSARYAAFKSMLEQHEKAFEAAEMREFYMFSINHCIRQTNRGTQHLEAEVLQLYRRALEAGYLFENGVLSRFTYHNIVAAGLRCRELDWVEDFIPRYALYLEPAYRDSSLSFNQARLDYARHRFDSVLLLLQKANYRDPLLNLAAKTLLLKTYFTLNEYDLLQSHLDAMRNYIQRKKVIGYHRTNYHNIIRYTERVLHLEATDRSTRETLQRDIEKEPVLSEKEWLLGLLEVRGER